MLLKRRNLVPSMTGVGEERTSQIVVPPGGLMRCHGQADVSQMAFGSSNPQFKVRFWTWGGEDIHHDDTVFPQFG